MGENARKRLAAARCTSLGDDHDYTTACSESLSIIAAILAADPQLEADIELGQAWREVEAALPSGWWLQLDGKGGGFRAMAGESIWDPTDYVSVGATGSAPVEALHNLLTALREGLADG